MIKYIIKRLLLSLIILIGVSIALYILIRMLPMDYVETKFMSQMQQGTVTWEDLNDIKRLYGYIAVSVAVQILGVLHKSRG